MNHSIWNRRRFLQLSAAALPALSLRSALAQPYPPIGLELYTVRRELKKDLVGTLKQVRKIGYREVEVGDDLYNRPARDLRKIFEDVGLATPSGGVGYKAFPTSFQYAKDLGLKYMLLGDLPSSEEAYHRGAVKLNEWGKRAREMGMRVAFHTHDDVFTDFRGKTGLDILVQETDPELVFFEVDCYWVAQAGRDPVKVLNSLGRRVRMIHLKDRKPGFPPSTNTSASSQHFTEVGSGTIHWPEILKVARRLQVEHYFVEQDETDIPVMRSIQVSYNYLNKIWG